MSPEVHHPENLIYVRIVWKINGLEISLRVFDNLYFLRKEDTIRPVRLSGFFVSLSKVLSSPIWSFVLIGTPDDIICPYDQLRPEVNFHVRILRTSSPIVTLPIHFCRNFFFTFNSIVLPQRVRRPTLRASPLRFRRQTDNVLALHPSVTYSVQ